MRTRLLIRALSVSLWAVSCGDAGDGQAVRGSESVFNKPTDEGCTLSIQCAGDLVCRPQRVSANGEVLFACQPKAQAIETCPRACPPGCAMCMDTSDCQDGLQCQSIIPFAVSHCTGNTRSCDLSADSQCGEGEVCRPLDGAVIALFRCQAQAEVGGHCMAPEHCLEGLECQGGSTDPGNMLVGTCR